jgi:hypothetical protein
VKAAVTSDASRSLRNAFGTDYAPGLACRRSGEGSSSLYPNC